MPGCLLRGAVAEADAAGGRPPGDAARHVGAVRLRLQAQPGRRRRRRAGRALLPRLPRRPRGALPRARRAPQRHAHRRAPAVQIPPEGHPRRGAALPRPRHGVGRGADARRIPGRGRRPARRPAPHGRRVGQAHGRAARGGHRARRLAARQHHRRARAAAPRRPRRHVRPRAPRVQGERGRAPALPAPRARRGALLVRHRQLLRARRLPLAHLAGRAPRTLARAPRREPALYARGLLRPRRVRALPEDRGHRRRARASGRGAEARVHLRPRGRAAADANWSRRARRSPAGCTRRPTWRCARARARWRAPPRRARPSGEGYWPASKTWREAPTTPASTTVQGLFNSARARRADAVDAARPGRPARQHASTSPRAPSATRTATSGGYRCTTSCSATSGRPSAPRASRG